MSQWSLRDRLQPSLLDRLIDKHPEREKESPSEQHMDQSDLKAAVTRDLSALLNCVALEVIYPLDAYPLVRKSVLNYGVPEFSGQTASSLNARDIEQGIRQAIQVFEPRILRNGFVVKLHTNHDEMSANTLIFHIEGMVFGQPAPFQVSLRSELDLESGNITFADS